MSNPAVTKLVRDKIGRLEFWMDDNIGEAIHIHLADFRMDLTVEELHNLAEELGDTIDKLVDVEGFECSGIDPVFMSLFLAKNLNHLKAVKKDTVMLGDLLVNHKNRMGFIKFSKLENGRAVKALNGDSSENDGHRESHHVGQTSEQRLESMKSSISVNGYPFNGQYIILYEDQMLIRDGQHRASCLYVENGNIEIPVLRLYFDDPKIAKYEKSYIKQLFAKLKKLNAKRLLRKTKKFFKGLINMGSKCKRRLYFMFKKSEIRKMEQVYFR